MKKAVLSVVLLILVITMAGSGFLLARYFIDSRQQKEIFAELAEETAVGPQESQKSPILAIVAGLTGKEAEKEETAPVAPVCHDLNELRSRNGDCIGWITVPGTVIDYPVMQTADDPEYYLKHNFQKEYSNYGVPFLDYRCTSDGGNLILYGHNKFDGTMFTPLVYFPDPKVREGKIIRLELEGELREYEVAAAFSVDAAVSEIYDYPQLQTAADRDAFLRAVQKESGVELDAGVSEFVTLSTCDVSRRNGRIVVIGVRKEGDKC